MPQTVNSAGSDIDKLLEALSFVTSVRNFDDVLTVLGVGGLPAAQRNGIMFGILVFAVTITTVVTLLVKGGSFKRIVEQTEAGGVPIPDAIGERVGRPLLLERLLDAQERLLKNYPEESRSENVSSLTKMLLNVAPDVAKAKEVTDRLGLVDESDESDEGEKKKKIDEQLKKFIPDGYEENYIKAYRRCQDRPGGETISGQPEARFEAYARAYAGCGVYSSPAYRRSYARLYEAISCVNHATENKYRQHWLERPGDMVGRTIRLEPLEADRHLENLFSMTCGDTYKENRVYDPNEIWAFLPEGPFRNPEEMRRSFVFQRKANEGGFAIIESVTDKMLGVVYLSNDNPTNLSISLELPIVKPSSVGTVEPIEGCFLLIDRLFSLGYRRVQLSIDSMDYNGKRLSGRLGFTQEGLIPKDRIIKESNRDSLIYGMLNSDWDKGARAFMYKKLHGDRAMRADAANNEKEGELETQQKVLAAQKEEAAAKEPKK